MAEPTIINPVKFDGKERVALELMMLIAAAEGHPRPAEARAHYMTLFRQCLLIQQDDPEAVLALSKEPPKK